MMTKQAEAIRSRAVKGLEWQLARERDRLEKRRGSSSPDKVAESEDRVRWAERVLATTCGIDDAAWWLDIQARGLTEELFGLEEAAFDVLAAKARKGGAA